MTHNGLNPEGSLGLDELRQAIREEDARYEAAFDRALDQGQGHLPRRNYEKINTLRRKCPEAAAILDAEKRTANP